MLSLALWGWGLCALAVFVGVCWLAALADRWLEGPWWGPERDAGAERLVDRSVLPSENGEGGTDI